MGGGGRRRYAALRLLRLPWLAGHVADLVLHGFELGGNVLEGLFHSGDGGIGLADGLSGCGADAEIVDAGFGGALADPGGAVLEGLALLFEVGAGLEGGRAGVF
jgi:hypothetical protein